MITFSVITVTYNAGRLCEQTFRSVSEQTHPYVEHLIMDGASKDNTLELARAYQEENSIGASRHEVKVFSEPDGGLYEAMNKGLRQCTGDYVIFLNAGDAFPSSSTLELISDAIKGVSDNALPAVLYGDTDVVDENRQVLYRRKGNVPEKLSWRSFLKGMLVCHQAFYVRTDIAKLTPYDLQYRYSADVDWCIRVMKEAERRGLPMRQVDAVIANFLAGGDSKQNHRASLNERFHVMCKHYGFFSTIIMHLWFVIRGVVKK